MSPNHHDFMFIDEERKRVITYFVHTRDPLRWAPMRIWYRAASADSISVRLRSTDQWRVFSFQLDDDRVSWTFNEKVQDWRRVPWADRPEWLDERLATDHAKMDEAEKPV